jgi:hypothetical protein
MDLQVGDVVELRKPHPCGGRHWRILRVGADIGAECLTCQRYVLVSRSRFESRIKQLQERDKDTTL